jgi:hypothetical protein
MLQVACNIVSRSLLQVQSKHMLRSFLSSSCQPHLHWFHKVGNNIEEQRCFQHFHHGKGCYCLVCTERMLLTSVAFRLKPCFWLLSPLHLPPPFIARSFQPEEPFLR